MADPQANIEIVGIPNFWTKVGASHHAVLLLDYDGTLAPFHSDRMQARLLDGMDEQLDLLAKSPSTTVALISGRPVAEIQELTGITNMLIAGTHGFELFRPGMGIVVLELPDGVDKHLNHAKEVAASLVGDYRAERKVATVALHVRGLPEEDADRIATTFRVAIEPMQSPHLEIRDFNGGVELRVRGRDKGVAIREILAELPPADLVVYLGDDDTDEDAFRALPEHGIGIKVGGVAQPTAACGSLDSCEDVLHFLRDWNAIKT